jgi:HD-GYP domain-containing protein (c-di-GMP phosphodiesterase class II)
VVAENRSKSTKRSSGQSRKPPSDQSIALIRALAGRERCWDALERLAGDLGRCHDRLAATRRFLSAIHETLDAGAVYCCSAGGNGPVEIVGGPAPAGGRVLSKHNRTPQAPRVVEPAVSSSWCRTLLRLALAEAPGAENQLLLSRWSAPPELGAPVPWSVAMVRLRKSHDIWAVAVSLRPEQRFRPSDMTLLGLGRQLLTGAWQQQRAQGQLRDTILGLVRGFTTVVDGRDQFTAGHSERVARIALRLGQQMGLPAGDLGDLYLAGLLHDIGSVRLGDAILHKPGPLTDEEMAAVMEHPVIGAAFVAGVGPIAHLAPIVRSHHERYDGQGYPDGLAGERIPLLARILSVADSFDALLGERPYREARRPKQIEAILSSGAGSQWDEQVIRHLLACREEMYVLVGGNPKE